MATSNLKSLVIKQTRNITELISDSQFRLLYNAIKEIVDYWSQITINPSDKAAYMQKYGLTKLIDISGSIKVNNLYIKELQYICEHVNGNKLDTEGSPDGLNIAPGYNLYLTVSDIYMQECIVNTIYYNKITQDGLTILDIANAKFSWTEYQYGNSEMPLCGNYVEELFPYTNPNLSEDDRKNYLNNLPDYFLFNEQNNISQIKVFDFTPYYAYLLNYYNQSETGEKFNIQVNFREAFPYPRLWSTIPGLATSCHPQKKIDEFWIYLPPSVREKQYSMHFHVSDIRRSDNGSKGLWAHLTEEQCRQASKVWWEDNKRTTIDRLFIFCTGPGSNRPLPINGYVVNATHVYLDGWRQTESKHIISTGGREFGDPWGQPPTLPANFILGFAWGLEPPVTFSSDEEALAWLSNPSNIRWFSTGDYSSWGFWLNKTRNPDQFMKISVPAVYYSETDEEVLNGTKTTEDIKVPAGTVYNMYAFLEGWTIDYSWPCYVPDKFYYFCKYAKYVYNAEGTAPEGRQFYKEQYLRKWSDYKSFGNPYYNATTDKFWWQTNTTFNTIVSTQYPGENPHGWYNP